MLLVLLFSITFVASCGNGDTDEEPQINVPGQVVDNATNQPEESTDGVADSASLAGDANDNAGEADNNAGEAVPTDAPARIGVGSIPLEGTVILWHSWAQADADALNEIFGRVQEENPSLTLETLFVAHPDLEQSYIDAVQGGGGPDLVLAPNWWIGNFVEQQVAAPVAPLIAEDALDEYWPATVENLSWDGAAYGIPVNFELVSLFYNQSLISADNLPANTDDLLALMSTEGKQGIGLYNSLYHLYWGIPAFGGQLMDSSGRVILDQSDGTSEYLSWLITMDAAPNVYVDLDYGMLVDRFKKNEFAFFVDGPWSVNELRQSLGDNLQVALLPVGPAGSARPWLSADGFFLNPYIDQFHQQLAIAIALELTNVQNGTLLAQVSSKLPANRSSQINDPLLQGFMQQAEFADPMPSRPEIYHVLGYGGDMLIKALNGVSEPAETVTETAVLINEATGR